MQRSPTDARHARRRDAPLGERATPRRPSGSVSLRHSRNHAPRTRRPLREPESLRHARSLQESGGRWARGAVSQEDAWLGGCRPRTSAGGRWGTWRWRSAWEHRSGRTEERSASRGRRRDYGREREVRARRGVATPPGGALRVVGDDQWCRSRRRHAAPGWPPPRRDPARRRAPFVDHRRRRPAPPRSRRSRAAPTSRHACENGAGISPISGTSTS